MTARPSLFVPAVPRSALAALFGTAALTLVAAGAALPWVSIYGGLDPIPGFLLDGGPLAGLAAAAAGLLLAAQRMGGARALRPLAAILGLAVALDAAYAASRIAAYVADPGPAAALTQPTPGPGAVLMAAGGVLLACAAVALAPSGLRLSRLNGRRLLLAGTLLVAAWIHLLLTPEHAAESTVLGLGFLAAGIAQALLAALILVRSSHSAMVGAVAVNAALLGLYGWAITVGLPFGHGGEEIHASAGAGLAILSGEPIDLPGAVNAVAQVVGVALAFSLLGGRQRQEAGEVVTPEAPTRLQPMPVPMALRTAHSASRRRVPAGALGDVAARHR